VLAHIEYLLEIIKVNPQKGLEFGCGTGFHSCFISKFVKHLVCLDLNKDTIEIAKQNMKKFGKEEKVSFVVGDVFHLPFRPKSFDVAFSQGLLEHFDNNYIKEILWQITKCSKKIIASVPSINYPQYDLGDERLLSLDKWALLLSEYNAKVRYYKLDFQSIKNSLFRKKIPKPWHILIKIDTIGDKG
jgi:ubiquinone/menaquinone biosynthesis C-methylase UbiE